MPQCTDTVADIFEEERSTHSSSETDPEQSTGSYSETDPEQSIESYLETDPEQPIVSYSETDPEQSTDSEWKTDPEQPTDSEWKTDPEQPPTNLYSEYSPEQKLPGANEAFSHEPIVLSRVFWKTRQIALNQNDLESYVKLTIKELIVHVLFVILFIVFGSVLYSHETFDFNRKVSSLFTDSSFTMSSMSFVESSIKFHKIITMEHFWKYSQKILCEELYEKLEAEGNISNSNPSNTRHQVKLLFRPKARQVRVKEGECNIRSQFQGLFHECYAPYDIKYEDQSSFGLKNSTAWMYSDKTVTQEEEYTSKIANYGAGGYCFDFPSDKKDAQELIAGLEYNTWLDRGTRAVFMDFTFYNSDIEVICLAKLVFEFPAWGGVMPSSLFLTIKLHQLTSKFMYFIIFIFVVYFTVEEIFEIMYFRLNYLKIFWNYVDFGIVSIGWCVFGWAMAIGFKESSLNLNENNVADMIDYRFTFNLVSMHMTLNQMTVIMCCLIYIKIIKYIDLNKPMTFIYLSIELCFITIGKYLCEISIAVVAFAVFGYSVFGQQVKEYSTLYDTFRSTFGVLTGDFQSLEILGETPFISFWSIVFKYAAIIVLCRMLLIILIYAYFNVNAKELLGDRKVYVCDKILVFVESVLRRVGLRKWAKRLGNDRLNRKLQNNQIARQFEDLLLLHNRLETTSNQYGESMTMNQPNENSLATMNEVEVNALESLLENIQEKCDVLRARLSAIRSLFPTNYAEDFKPDIDDEIEE